MGRKGISFTLTVVVAGVILLMTALSIITLGGSSIQGFFDTITGQSEQAEVQKACGDLASQINQQYCSQYVKYDFAGETCSDAQPSRDSVHNSTASEYHCDFTNIGVPSDWEVTVDGNQYDCQEEGYIGESCPA